MRIESEKLSNPGKTESPRRVLTLFDCVCIIVGTIIGAGIFKMPAIVASHVPSVYWLVAVWVFGGIVALVGALCFAELTTTYPDRGGDYGYLKRAYHKRVGFAFSWAAFWVIRPTSIASMAMIFGEFATTIFPESWPSYQFAILSIAVFSLANLLGIRFGKSAQNVLTVAKVVGILLIVVAAFVVWPSSPVDDVAVGEPANTAAVTVETDNTQNSNDSTDAQDSAPDSTWEWFWLSMVFVMFTFGGWNDIAFVAGEVKDPKRNLLGALVIGTGVVLLVYLLVNLALVSGLGFSQLAALGNQDQNATSVLVDQNMGPIGNYLLSILVCISCLGAINAMILTSPRIYWATAVDYAGLDWMGALDGRGWWRSMLFQAVVTIAFILTFGIDSNGVQNLTAANAPYFWSFLGLTVISLIVNRIRFKGVFDGYRVPLYPVLPVFFAGVCLFMVYRSWTYMLAQELWIPTFVIGGWVLVGFVLSFVLKSRPSASEDRHARTEG